MTWQNEIEKDLFKSFVDSFEPIDVRPVHEWAKGNIVIPAGYNFQVGCSFNPDISPYITKPMDDLTNPNIQQLNFCCSTQTFKSGINEIFTVWEVLQNPGNMLRIHQNDNAASECMTSRIIPMMQNNPATKRLYDRSTYNTKNGLLKLPNGTFIKSTGPALTNLQSKSIKYLVLEEVKFYENDTVITEAKARTTGPGVIKSRKIIIASEPDYEGSPLHKEFISGDVYYYGWTCPNCKKLQKYEFDGERNGKYYGLIWTAQNEKGTLSDDERTNNTKLVCQHCFHEIVENEDNRIALVNNGDYILDSSGDSSIRSYSWPQFVNKDFTFKMIAMSYLRAKREYERTGINDEKKKFKNKVLGLFWPKGGEIDMPKLMQDITTGNETWPDETHRFLTIDVQQACMYWLVTAWSNKVAEARLIDWGVSVGFNELILIKNKYNIKPIHIAIDSGDDTKPIYKESIIRGATYMDKTGKKIFAPWLCLKGDGGKGHQPRIEYPGPDNEKRYYSEESRPDPQWPAGHKLQGYRARLRLWSNYSIKTILTNVRDGKVPFKFRYNERADETFQQQLYSETINPKSGRYENFDRPNHLFDCLCMSYVLALMSKCYIPEASNISEVIKKPDVLS